MRNSLSRAYVLRFKDAGFRGWTGCRVRPKATSGPSGRIVVDSTGFRGWTGCRVRLADWSPEATRMGYSTGLRSLSTAVLARSCCMPAKDASDLLLVRDPPTPKKAMVRGPIGSVRHAEQVQIARPSSRPPLYWTSEVVERHGPGLRGHGLATRDRPPLPTSMVPAVAVIVVPRLRQHPALLEPTGRVDRRHGDVSCSMTSAELPAVKLRQQVESHSSMFRYAASAILKTLASGVPPKSNREL